MVKLQNLEAVEFLIQNNADPQYPDKVGRPFEASLLGKEDQSKLKLKATPPPFLYLSWQHQNTPLHSAVQVENIKAVKMLLSSSANVNSQNVEGDAPLHLAVKKLNKEIIDLLLANSETDLNLMNYSFATPFWLALEAHSEELAQHLVEKGI